MAEIEPWYLKKPNDKCRPRVWEKVEGKGATCPDLGG